MVSRSFLVIAVVILAAMLAAPACYAGCGCQNAQPCAGMKNAVKPDPCAERAAAGYCNSDAWRKLGRGLANIVTFPLEIPYQISKANISDGPVAAMTWGVVKGVGMTGFRALVGVYETISFPFPYPEGYKPILTDPEFFLEEQIC